MDKEFWMQFKSYSRYRGICDDSEYSLSDEYLWKEVDGNLICTDEQCDIDCDGNICLVTPDGDILHIGEVPELEQGAGRPQLSINGNELTLRYKEFLDNGHHHCTIREEKIDLTLTKDRIEEIIRNRAKKTLWEELKPINSGSFRSEYPDIMDGGDTFTGIQIRFSVEKLGYQGMSKTFHIARVYINYNEKENKFAYIGGHIYGYYIKEGNTQDLSHYYSNREPEQYEEAMKSIHYGVQGGLSSILAAIDKANEKIKDLSFTKEKLIKKTDIERD